MVFEKKEFGNALKKVSGALSNKTALPELECFKLIKNGNELTVAATNLAVYCESKVTGDSEIDEADFVVCIPGKTLQSIVGIIPDDRFVFSEIDADKRMFEITSESCSYKIQGLAVESFPKKEEIKDSRPISISGKEFGEAIGTAIGFASLDGTKAVHCGVKIEIQPGNMNIVALDGYRLYKKALPISYMGDGFDVILSKDDVRECRKAIIDIEDDVELLFGHRTFGVKTDAVEIRGPLLHGDFMEWRRAIPQSFKTETEFDLEDIKTVLERSAVIEEDKVHGKPLKIEISGRDVTFSAENATSSSKETVTADTTGDDLTIGCRLRYLSEALNAFNCEKVVFRFNTEHSGFILEPAGTAEKDTVVLVLPVRLT